MGGGSGDNTARFAKALWTPEGHQLSPAEFQSRFDALYNSAQGPATLWFLGGAANEYLMGHPGMIRVPEALAPALLQSRLVDARIIGLKLLSRHSADIAAIVSAIARALDARHEGELYGGLYELHLLLRRVEPSVPMADLTPKLARLNSSRDPYVRDCANRFLGLLQPPS